MATLYTMLLSTHKPGMVKGPVKAVMGGLREWPDMAAARECLPHYYRKAFDRAGTFWADKSDDKRPLYMTLRDTRGKYLNTLYAQPYEFNA